MLPHWRVLWRVNYIYQKESYKSIKQGGPFLSRSFILGGPQTRPLHHRVFYDNEDPEERVIILATGQDLLLLKRSPSRLQAELPNHQGGAPWVFPCVYILLTHKTQDNYLEAFILLNFLLDFSPQVIMSDFEKAIRNSLSEVFHTNKSYLFQFDDNKKKGPPRRPRVQYPFRLDVLPPKTSA